MVGDRDLVHQDVPAAPVPATSTTSAADAGDMVGAGEQDLPQAPAAPAPEPAGAQSSGEIHSAKEDSSTPSAPAPATAAVEVAGGTSQHLHLRRAPTSPDGRQQQARSGSGAESGRASTNQHTVAWSNDCRTRLCVGAYPKCAKWVYGALFLVGIVLARWARDIEESAFTHHANVYNGYNDGRYLLGAESALRVSLAYFVFFATMFFSTLCTKKVHDCGNFWNSNLGGALFAKIFILVVCIFVVQFIPSPYIEYYGNAARFGGWFFLAIQLISVTRLIMKLNRWHQLNPQKWPWLVTAISILLNFGSFGFTFWLLHEHRSDRVDFAIVVVTLVLMVITIILYSISEVTAGWLTHGVMIAYVVYMCWTVLRSEPHTDFTKAKHEGADWLTITCFVGLGIVTAYSTFSTGEDHDWLQFNEVVPCEDDIPYGYAHFHLVLALGSMYFGMLLVGWNAYQTMEWWTADFGWWSAVVRAVNGFLAAVLYIWMLRTPFIWNKRKLVVSFSWA